MTTEERREKEILCLLREIKEKCPDAWPTHVMGLGPPNSEVIFCPYGNWVPNEIGFNILECHFQKIADQNDVRVLRTPAGYSLSYPSGLVIFGHSSRLWALCDYILSEYSEKKPDPKATKTPTLEDLSRRLEAVERRLMEK